MPSKTPASTQLNFLALCNPIASMIRAILTSGSMRSLRHKPDRSCATKPGHISCHRHGTSGRLTFPSGIMIIYPDPRDGVALAAFKSEWWPASRRNSGRLQDRYPRPASSEYPSSRPRLCGTANAGSGGVDPVAIKPIGSAALGHARPDRFVEAVQLEHQNARSHGNRPTRTQNKMCGPDLSLRDRLIRGVGLMLLGEENGARPTQ